MQHEARSLFDTLETAADQSDEAVAYREAEARFQELAHAGREQALYEQIENYEMEYGTVPHAVVVYGNAHEFAESLKLFRDNNDPAAIDRGLIEIKIKD